MKQYLLFEPFHRATAFNCFVLLRQIEVVKCLLRAEVKMASCWSRANSL